MPVRSSSSSVLKWPNAADVAAALRTWAAQHLAHPHVRAVGWFGSYARGDWGVGSDLDVVLLVSESEEPLVRRAAAYDTGSLPVPVDLLVYTSAEWQAMAAEGRRFITEVSWIDGVAPGPS